VTKLGEFSPLGRLFTLGSALKITVVDQIIRVLFSPESIVLNSFNINGLGYILGDFLHEVIWSS
jgi:hypothetical protein